MGPINEFAPIFFFGPYILEATEAATPGYYILNMFGFDLDAGLDGKIEYAITGKHL